MPSVKPQSEAAPFKPGPVDGTRAPCDVLDAAGMSHQRLTLWSLAEGEDISRWDDHAVMAALVERRMLTQRPVLPLYGMGRVQAAAPAAQSAPAAAPRPAGSAAAPAPAMLTTLGSAVDAAALAQVLREAAQSGVPFCEECQRRAA